MDTQVDHYKVLGLPSGEEGTKLTQIEISKAYRAKALDLHPDKRPEDPHANANFQRLKSSYDILKDRNARKLFDASLRAKREELHHQNRLHEQHNNATKQGRMFSGDGRHCHAKLASDLQARARERRWAPTWREARGRRAAVNGPREELFGDLEGILKRVQQQQYHDQWQCDAKPETCSFEPERYSSISKKENEEMLRGEYHLKLLLILLFFFALWSMV
ncbi:dnaJ homolog subfamily C member 17-like [Rosa chinensis]|uniref:dnaJ homolog subfamily C member 17-like n=1 Tax=Rosa chinensis TaxID=74649 RepID=UPI000D087C80|nr:dnaJ homolog subfamily C member 17-like [Rosa chinensis]